MRIVAIVARYLLGMMFTVFGLNGFLNFIHQPPPPNPLALQFFIAISASHFSAFFFAVQLVAGLLLLSMDTSYRWRSSSWLLKSSTSLPSISRWHQQRLVQAS